MPKYTRNAGREAEVKIEILEEQKERERDIGFRFGKQSEERRRRNGHREKMSPPSCQRRRPLFGEFE